MARLDRLGCRHHIDVPRYDRNVPMYDWHDGYMATARYDRCAWYVVRHDRYVARYDGYVFTNDSMTRMSPDMTDMPDTCRQI